MKLDQPGNVDVAKSIAVGQTEGLLVQILSHSPQPSGGFGHLSCLGESDGPAFLGMPAVKLNRTANAEVHCKVSHAGLIVQEKIFNYIPLISQAQNKFVQPEMGIGFHYVP